MNDFRTPIKLSSPTRQMGLNHRILTLGSCFSDAIGARLRLNKFQTRINPFGIIYNPVSIHNLLMASMEEKAVPESTFLQHGDIHLNYNFHSSFSSFERPVLENQISSAISETKLFLQKCDYLLITYGTSWVYKLKHSGVIVANCHKRPSELFEKSLLAMDQIISSFEEMSRQLLLVSPGIKIILTLSPVRHLKDTLELNCVSKSVLRMACHYLAEKFTHVEYFPAYEMVMDDLRDYRFYKADMIHPNEQAEDYIWEKFVEHNMNDTTLEFIRKWKTVYPALEHRAFHPGSAGHQIFLRQTLHKLEELGTLINVDAEKKYIEAQLLHSFNANQTST